MNVFPGATSTVVTWRLRPSDFEQRVIAAREAMLALYLDSTTPDAARLLVTFEQTVLKLRKQRQPAGETPGAGEGE